MNSQTRKNWLSQSSLTIGVYRLQTFFHKDSFREMFDLILKMLKYGESTTSFKKLF